VFLQGVPKRRVPAINAEAVGVELFTDRLYVDLLRWFVANYGAVG